MRSKAGPSAKKLDSVAVAEKFLGNEAEHAIVGYFSDDNIQSGPLNEFMQVADALNEDFRFAHSSEADVMAKYEQKEEWVQ